MDQVLLIEAHALLRSTLRDLLAQGGYEAIAEASDPVEAVHYTRLFRPPIIILDSNWREFGGLYLTRILRELAPASRIVLLVDDGRLADRELKRSSGADALVPKQALVKELLPVLNHWRES